MAMLLRNVPQLIRPGQAWGDWPGQARVRVLLGMWQFLSLIENIDFFGFRDMLSVEFVFMSMSVGASCIFIG